MQRQQSQVVTWEAFHAFHLSGRWWCPRHPKPLPGDAFAGPRCPLAPDQAAPISLPSVAEPHLRGPRTPRLVSLSLLTFRLFAVLLAGPCACRRRWKIRRESGRPALSFWFHHARAQEGTLFQRSWLSLNESAHRMTASKVPLWSDRCLSLWLGAPAISCRVHLAN